MNQSNNGVDVLVPTMPVTLAQILHQTYIDTNQKRPFFNGLLLQYFDIEKAWSQGDLTLRASDWGNVIVDNGYAENQYTSSVYTIERACSRIGAHTVVAAESNERPTEEMEHFIDNFPVVNSSGTEYNYIAAPNTPNTCLLYTSPSPRD